MVSKLYAEGCWVWAGSQSWPFSPYLLLLMVMGRTGISSSEKRRGRAVRLLAYFVMQRNFIFLFFLRGFFKNI